MWWIFIFVLAVTSGNALRLAAYISAGGLHGEIRFEKVSEDTVKIRTALHATLQYPDQQWLWSVTRFPVDYSKIEDRCSEQHLGESDTYSPRTICTSINVLETNAEKNAEARFQGPVAGSVWFRWLGGDSITDTIIYTDLHHTSENKAQSGFTEHHWKIYVTDIFDSEKEKNDCNILQTVFDPDDLGEGKAIGDIDARLGKIKVATDTNKKSKAAYKDPVISLLPADILGSHRSLYLVIFHPTHSDSFLACAKIKNQKFTLAKSLINSHGVKGEVTFTQETRFHPTWVNVSLSPINDLETRLRYETKTAAYKIHELPREPLVRTRNSEQECLSTKAMYNPSNVDDKTIPPAGLGTQDQYAIGDLSGKLQGRKEGSHHNDILPGSAKLSGAYWDTFLPLTGVYSILHRSLVLYKYVK
ncbi:GSCOCG00003917001-RA-CDS [Cotesia congregata]|nr:GSCOCG00003917001-RA-CDS [Cotesia congregata]